MSSIDESIVREYFEQNGYLVRQLRKYQVQSRKKTTDEEVDLLVYNPSYQPNSRKPDFMLFSSELAYIHKAVVVVKGWHTLRFTPSMLKSSPEIFRFLEKTVVKKVSDLFFDDTKGSAEGDEGKDSDLLKILVLPGLPTENPYREQSMQLLQEKGVDGIISFRSMLLDILAKIEINRNYQKSEILQVLRILKNYDLLGNPQMELFK
ncbi:MAG: hypothetical protein CMI18_03385 [Opitutaceae bacterium]|nr:hypothetical protein [Opitutaceae bacterium]|tara:strand:+ start:23532 stop:24149 length:618 start_codon:yes stop_codon:yes gene_type:complete